MKKLIVYLISFAFLSAIFGALSFIGVGFYWLNNAKLEFMHNDALEVQRLEELEAKTIGPSLDAGSVVKLRDLKSFYLFTDGKPDFEKWYESGLKNEDFKKLNSAELLIEKDIVLPALSSNKCRDLYCYQSPMLFHEIPASFWRGLMGIEDYRFLEHRGVDPISIARAIWVDLRAMKFVQGGSTLTQQLVKNLFLTSEKTLIRKLKEVVFATYIESKFTKEDILTAYFNEVHWGAFQGVRIKGLMAASLFYFNKRPHQLSEYETAILISMLKGPNFYHPVRRMERLRKRVDVVFNRLQDLGLISKKYHKGKWEDEQWSHWHKGLENNYKEKNLYNIWLTTKENPGSLEKFQQYALYQGVSKSLEELKERTENVDYGIKIIIGTPLCEKDCVENFNYYSKYERNREVAFEDERHQIGSIVKPIVYSIYQRLGTDLQGEVDAGPIELDLKSGKWSPGEATKNPEPTLKIIDALLKSRNRPTIRLAQINGFQEVEDLLVEYIPELKTPLDQYPAQMLGAVELSMNETFETYTKFLEKQCEKNLDEGFENTILYQLSDPKVATIRNMVRSRLKEHRFFGKTGTTNNGWDSWYVTFDGRYLAIIWFGVEKREEGKKVRLSGASAAFRIFQNYLESSGKRFNELAKCSVTIPSDS